VSAFDPKRTLAGKEKTPPKRGMKFVLVEYLSTHETKTAYRATSHIWWRVLDSNQRARFYRPLHRHSVTPPQPVRKK